MPLPLSPDSLSMAKKRATPSVLRTYFDNRSRLAAEMAKTPRDRWVENNIRAYLHILKALEERYDICESGAATPVAIA